MNFTIFLNTRGRVAQLSRCLDAVENNAKDPSKIELLIRCDHDDKETIDFLQARKFKFAHEVIIGPRPESLCGSFNEMARKGKGKYLFVFTDDAEIMTPNWDVIALAKINAFKKEKNIKDDIIYGQTYDTSIDKPPGSEYASFPIISKEAVETLGFFMFDSFVGLGGDSSIYRVYRSIDRIVDLSEIKIDHVYNNTLFKVMTPDLTGFEMRQRTSQRPVDPFTFTIDNEVNKLKAHIAKKNKV